MIAISGYSVLSKIITFLKKKKKNQKQLKHWMQSLVFRCLGRVEVARVPMPLGPGQFIFQPLVALFL